MEMSKSKAIRRLRELNRYYGSRAEEFFEDGDRERGLNYGSAADDYGEAADMLENGHSFEEVREKFEGILRSL